MHYKAIKYFTDLQDKGHPYAAGDIYPRAGLKVTKKRIGELLSDQNKQEVPLIEEAEEPEDSLQAGE